MTSQKKSILSCIVEVGIKDSYRVFWYPVPPLQNYDDFTDSSLDLSSIFCKGIEDGYSSDCEDDANATTITTTDASSSSCLLLKFEDDIVNTFLNCICYHGIGSEFSGIAFEMLQSLPSIFAKWNISPVRKFLINSQQQQQEQQEDPIKNPSQAAVQSVCLRAMRLLASREGFDILSQHRGGELLQRLSSSNNSVVPLCVNDLVTKLCQGYYFCTNQFYRDLQLILISAIASTPRGGNSNNLTLLTKLRKIHLGSCFRHAIDHFESSFNNQQQQQISNNVNENNNNNNKKKKEQQTSNLKSRKNVTSPDQIYLHNVPQEFIFVEAPTPSQFPSKTWTILKSVVTMLMVKDASIQNSNNASNNNSDNSNNNNVVSHGIMSYPCFDDNLASFIQNSQQQKDNEKPLFLYLLQYQLVHGKIPISVAVKNQKSSTSKSSNINTNVDAIMKGEVDLMVNQMLTRRGTESIEARQASQLRFEVGEIVKSVEQQTS